MSILRGDRMFVRLAEIGDCNSDGKTIFGLRFKGKAVGEPDRPLGTLAVGFIAQLIDLARYSSPDAANADLAELKAYVESLGGCEPTKDPVPMAVKD